MHIVKTSTNDKDKTVVLPKLIILSILAVAFWRGLWWLFDVYFFPGNPFISNLLCLIVPVIVIVIWIIVSGFRISWDMDFPIDHHVL